MKPDDDDEDTGQHDHIAALMGLKRHAEETLRNLQHHSDKQRENRFGGGRQLSLAITNIEQGIFWLEASIQNV